MNESKQMQALVPKSVPEAVQLSETLSQASLVPKHLQGKPGDCLLVIMQAQRWGMDALSVAQCTSVVHGKLCYEGKLVAAVLYSMGAVEGRLQYEFSGSGDNRTITVTGKPRGTDMGQSVVGTVKDWRTGSDNWSRSPDDMLVYRGTRQWARRYAPEALLGVYTPDELTEPQEPVSYEQPNEPKAYSQDDFDRNFQSWKKAIESGVKSAQEIITLVSTKGTLTPEMTKAINDCEIVEAEFKETQE